MSATAARSKSKTTARPRAPKVASGEGSGVARARLFANGRSQAVRLPKEFRLPGTEVLIRRDGRRLILEPVDAEGWPLGLWDRLDEIARGLDGQAWQRPPDAVPQRIEAERDLP